MHRASERRMEAMPLLLRGVIKGEDHGPRVL
jgi:hypothetical protein